MIYLLRELICGHVKPVYSVIKNNYLIKNNGVLRL